MQEKFRSHNKPYRIEKLSKSSHKFSINFSILVFSNYDLLKRIWFFIRLFALWKYLWHFQFVKIIHLNTERSVFIFLFFVSSINYWNVVDQFIDHQKQKLSKSIIQRSSHIHKYMHARVRALVPKPSILFLESKEWFKLAAIPSLSLFCILKCFNEFFILSLSLSVLPLVFGFCYSVNGRDLGVWLFFRNENRKWHKFSVWSVWGLIQW